MAISGCVVSWFGLLRSREPGGTSCISIHLALSPLAVPGMIVAVTDIPGRRLATLPLSSSKQIFTGIR